MRALYDPFTDTIQGAERGSLAWFHEKRHQIQYNNTVVRGVDGFLHDFAQQYIFYFSVGVFISGNHLFAVYSLAFGILLYSLWNIILEVDAWIYSLKKWRSGQNG